MPRIATRWLLLLAAAAFCSLAAAQTPHQGQVELYPATEEGDWDGTWVFGNRDFKIVLWLQSDSKGKPSMRWQYQDLANAEMFVTDWEGKADYTMLQATGKVSLNARELTPHSIKGELVWETDYEDAIRSVTGAYEIFRVNDGRFLMIYFPLWKRVIQKGDDVRISEVPQSWTFRKLSKRQLRWEEIPF
jgi:hypothetical protein